MKLSERLSDPRVEAMVQYVLFTILVVATPFVVVTRFLQGAVNTISHWSFPLFGLDIPYVLMIAVACIAALIIWQVRHLTLRRLKAMIISLLMIAFGHQVQDLYLDLSFFDLQQNWHYIAYGAYAFFFFRAFNARNMPKNRMILLTFLSAILMSTFDETFQFFMSDRVFDISDISKDALGAVIGIILVLFVTESYGTISLKGAVPRKHIREYFCNPASALVMITMLTLVFILFSPLLSEHEHWRENLLVGFGVFLVLFAAVHFSQYRPVRIAVIVFVAVLVAGLAVSHIVHRGRNISFNTYGLTVYQGIPIPFFDFLVYPNGWPRLVNKKHHFGSIDKHFFQREQPDILLISSGTQGRGGKGFDRPYGTYFMFNRYSNRGMQVIILRNEEACRKFNELKAAGKNVLLIFHNTC